MDINIYSTKIETKILIIGFNRHSQAMSKFLIGSHNSSMSEDEEAYLPMSTHGRLWYSLVYDAAVEQLTVTLIKVKDLPGESVATFAHNGSNPLCQAPSPSDHFLSKITHLQVIFINPARCLYLEEMIPCFCGLAILEFDILYFV